MLHRGLEDAAGRLRTFSATSIDRKKDRSIVEARSVMPGN